MHKKIMMDLIKILIITHTPYVLLAIAGIILLRVTRKNLEVLNKNIRRS